MILAALAPELILGPISASAGETDNYALPLDADMADLGVYLETVHTMALQEAVAAVNARIEKALLVKDKAAREGQLGKLHDPLALAEAFAAHFGHPLFEDNQLDKALRRRAWARQMYPGQKTCQPAFWLNFASHFPLDLRRWTMLIQSSTVKANGVYFGGDKLVHFHNTSLYYYRRHRSLLAAGLDPEAAAQEVIEHYARHAFLSEDYIFGLMATGVFSNADLAVNYAGFKFYGNLSEAVRLNGEEREPLVLRTGVFWRLNRYVRPGSGWFSIYISDHWNEALNPNLYDFTMRPGVRCILRSRAERIVQFYTQKDNRPNDPEYFENLARQLSTYYGEPYGHSGRFESIMTIGNTCMPRVKLN